MKIWIKLIIAGIIIFFVGVFYSASMGGIMKGPVGIVIGMIGLIIIAVGVLAGLKRGFNRMMSE